MLKANWEKAAPFVFTCLIINHLDCYDLSIKLIIFG